MHFNLIKIVILAITAGPFAMAGSFSFTGSLMRDDSVELFSFTLASNSTVILQTCSYAGGPNQSGTVVPRGGFDPILSIFNSVGELIHENDDGYANVPADSATGRHWDSYIRTTLAAGTYTVALTQYENFPNGPNLGNGFSKVGQPQFTSAFGCLNGGFCDRTGNNRTANWEFDIIDAASASAAPEPTIPALIVTGIAILGLLRGRRALWKLPGHEEAKNFNLNSHN